MKKRVRSTNQNGYYRSKRYTFHSYGSVYTFNPFKIITDDRIVNEANYFESMPALDFYKNEVRMARKAGQHHVYILDEKGEEVAA